jgi:hypothetical protein
MFSSVIELFLKILKLLIHTFFKIPESYPGLFRKRAAGSSGFWHWDQDDGG